MKYLESLFGAKFNWGLFISTAVVIFISFPDLSTFSFLAILITLHQFTLMFNAIGYAIPVRYLFGAFMCLQLLLGPMLAYNGLDKYQFVNYRMKIPEADYFNYVLPAVIAFILGLHFCAGKLEGEFVKEEAVKEFVANHNHLPYIFIGIGFVSSVLAGFFSNEYAFIFVLLGGAKFIGAFMLILGNKQLKILPLIIVYGSIVVSSLGIGMFHDLLTWILFLGYFVALKFKPGIFTKRLAVVIFILGALAIQQLKGGYREATWERGEETGIASLNRAYEESSQKNNFFTFQSLAKSNVRFNQGYIITNIMSNVPAKVPFSNGTEMMQIFEAALLPRVLAPNKLNAGDRDIFMKYSGMKIAVGTSMGLSSIGDAYINFGSAGGAVFMFFLGFLYNLVLKGFNRFKYKFPILLLFTPLVFYYPIRPDCELQTILGHLVKSCFLIFTVFVLWKKYFIIYPRSSEKDTHFNSLVPSRL